MTTKSFVWAAIAVASVVAACGSSAATPTSKVAVSPSARLGASPSLAASKSPGASATATATATDLGTIGLPHIDAALEDLLPSTMGGISLTKFSEPLSSYDASSPSGDKLLYPAWLVTVGKTPDDVNIAIAWDPLLRENFVVHAIKVPGVGASTLTIDFRRRCREGRLAGLLQVVLAEAGAGDNGPDRASGRPQRRLRLRQGQRALRRHHRRSLTADPGPGRPALIRPRPAEPYNRADMARQLDRPIREAWIVASLRTPFGRYGGALASVRPDDLAAAVIRALVDRTGIDPALIEDVILGCANQAGEDNRNVARMAALLAGLPVEVGGLTVNRLCGSGLQAVNSAAHAIAVGDGDVFIAGGVESMSRAPYVMLKPETAFERGTHDLVDTTLGWRFVNPALAASHHPYSMGETGENVAERLGIGREDQDAFALASQRRAAAASAEGRLRGAARADLGSPAQGRADRRGRGRATATGHLRRRHWHACGRRSAKAAR